MGNGEEIKVFSPYNGEIVGITKAATKEEVNVAIEQAHTASIKWNKTPLKERTQVMFRFRDILMRDIEEIANMVSLESGKILGEAKAGVMKGSKF